MSNAIQENNTMSSITQYEYNNELKCMNKNIGRCGECERCISYIPQRQKAISREEKEKEEEEEYILMLNEVQKYYKD